MARGSLRRRSSTPAAHGTASTQLLPPGSAEIEEDLFWTRVVGPLDKAPGSSGVPERRATEALPFRVSGGEPRLRDVYPVMAQPVAPGSLSGWVGRYAT